MRHRVSMANLKDMPLPQVSMVASKAMDSSRLQASMARRRDSTHLQYKANMARLHHSKATRLLLPASTELLSKASMPLPLHTVSTAHHPSRAASVDPRHNRLSAMALSKLPIST
jgi:hypothetical protein